VAHERAPWPLPHSLAPTSAMIDRAARSIRTRARLQQSSTNSTRRDLRTLRAAHRAGRSWSNFLLAYQNRDDRRIAEAVSATGCIARHRAGARTARRLPETRRNRVARASGWSRRTGTICAPSVRISGAGSRRCARLDIDLHVVHLGPREDGRHPNDFAARAPHFPPVWPGSWTASSRRRARSTSTWRSFRNLAWIQRLFAAAAAGRGASRSGWPGGTRSRRDCRSVSHYLSCGEMEPAGATAVLSGIAVRLLPGIGTRFELPASVRSTCAAAPNSGLPAGPLAIVPQSIFKVLPHNDAIYARLLDARGDLRIAFFGADPGEDAARFRRRLRDRRRRPGRGAPAVPARAVARRLSWRRWAPAT
jgi:hypothetical protein